MKYLLIMYSYSFLAIISVQNVNATVYAIDLLRFWTVDYSLYPLIYELNLI